MGSKFKRVMFIAATSLLILSCATENMRRKICAECQIHDFKDSSTKITERIIHDTVKLPGAIGPVRWLSHPCANLCDSLGKLKPLDIKETKNGINTEIKSKGDSLLFTASKDSTKVPVIEKEKTINTKVETKGTTVIHDPCHNERTGWDEIGHWCFWIVLFEFIILILYILWRIYKPKVPKL